MEINLRGLRPGRHRLACPACDKGPRDKALAVLVRDDGALCYCHRCGAVGASRLRRPAADRNPIAENATPRMRRTIEAAAAAEVANMARIRAQWNGATAADPAHPYLVRKGVTPTNWRQCGDKLLVPLRREGWGLVDLQYIDPDGEKRFAKGISTRGLYYVARWLDDGPLNICEGAATAVAIAERINETTIAAMSRGNLLPVAQMLRHQYPKRDFMLWADNDHRTPGNPGKIDAIWTAMQIHAAVKVPIFPPGSSGTDFLDLWQEQERRA